MPSPAPRALFVVLVILLLAGCMQSVDRPPLRARLTHLQVPPSEEYPGVVVRGFLGGTDRGLRVQAEARNDGNVTYKVETGCTTPWRDTLYFGNDTVPFRQPEPRCDAFALRSFAPGDDLDYDVEWDGRVWDQDANRMVKAQPGNYTWSVRFVAYQDGASTGAKRFDLDFEVTVLPG